MKTLQSIETFKKLLRVYLTWQWVANYIKLISLPSQKFNICLLKSTLAIPVTQGNWSSRSILYVLVTFINIYRHNVKQRVAPSTRTATPVIESWLPALEWPGRLRRRTVEPSAPTTAQHMYVQQTKKIKNNTNNSSFKRLLL